MPKKITQKEMACAPDEKCFWVHEGPALKNLAELRDALANMNKETFAHHVHKGKNDFAHWVDDALGEPALAKKLGKLKTLPSTLKAVDDYLKA